MKSGLLLSSQLKDRTPRGPTDAAKLKPDAQTTCRYASVW